MDSSFAAPPPAKGRTLAEVNVISTQVLERSISPWFYMSLLVAPIEDWIVVRRNSLARGSLEKG